MPAPVPKWVSTRNKHHILDLGGLTVKVSPIRPNAYTVALDGKEQAGVYRGVEEAMDAGVRAAYAFANEIKHALDRYRMAAE